MFQILFKTKSQQKTRLNWEQQAHSLQWVEDEANKEGTTALFQENMTDAIITVVESAYLDKMLKKKTFMHLQTSSFC